MSNEETLYARYLSGEITKEEEELLKSNGDWKKLERLIEMADSLTLPDIKNRNYIDQIV